MTIGKDEDMSSGDEKDGVEYEIILNDDSSAPFQLFAWWFDGFLVVLRTVFVSILATFYVFM